jgi:hypothetical protein
MTIIIADEGSLGTEMGFKHEDIGILDPKTMKNVVREGVGC